MFESKTVRPNPVIDLPPPLSTVPCLHVGLSADYAEVI